MPRNRVIYNVQDVLVGPPESGYVSIYPNKHILQRLYRISSFSYSFSPTRTDIKELGRRNLAASSFINHSPVQITLDYHQANVANEAKLGFNVDWAGVGDYLGVSLISGFCDESRSLDKRNIYLVIGNSGDDLHKVYQNTIVENSPITDFVDPNARDYSLVAFVNSYLTNYKTEASIGDVIRTSVQFLADDVRVYASGSGILEPSISYVSGSGISTATEIFIPKHYEERQPPALLPGDIEFRLLGNYNLDWGTLWEDVKLQSYSLEIKLDREENNYLGFKVPVDRPIVFPVFADLSISMVVGDSLTGSFSRLLEKDVSYNFAITAQVNPNIYGTHIAVRYVVKKAKLQAISYESNIGANKLATISFRTELDPQDISKGIFVSGMVPTPFYYDTTIIGPTSF